MRIVRGIRKSMRKTITTTSLLNKEHMCNSITVEPFGGQYKVTYFLKKRGDRGQTLTRYFTVKEIIEDDDVMWDGNLDNVKHLGYTSYKFYKNPLTGFYINLYRK